MGVRVVRHMGARSMSVDDAKLMSAIPYFAGEDLRALNIHGYAATSAIDDANQLNEINWTVLAVPWVVLLSNLGNTYTFYNTGSLTMDTAADYDFAFRTLVFEMGADGNEYYGGESSHGSEDDFVPASSEIPASSGDADEPLLSPARLGDNASKGPSGIRRLFSREVLMLPKFPGTATSGQTVFEDEFKAQLRGGTGHLNGGLIMVGAVRYSADAETNFSVEFDADETRNGIAAAIGGDYSRVQALIRRDTGELGDNLRTMLFGGDNYIESNTLKGVTSKNYVKCQAWFTTPYDIDA